VLFVSVKGLNNTGLILNIAQKIEKGNAIPLKLVVTTFFLSMLVTNDIALIAIVPLTLSLNINRKGILVILEALAANAGSALTPFGNPQNLFIYWFYEIHPVRFIETIAPFSLAFLIILIVASLFVNLSNNDQETIVQKVNKKARIYGALVFVVLLTVLHVVPVVTGILVIIFALIFDRKALHVDYALLFSFFFFFGLAENMKLFLASEMSHSGHIFLFSALASQVMSNVPATLLFAKFTTNWEALLWGVNAGGFGSLFGSLANLIAYKIYVTNEGTNNSAMFTAQFLIIGYIAFFLSIGLYFFLYKVQGL
jgi:Na+/H+ antiporter NhaD/arsenite permease-like protein